MNPAFVTSVCAAVLCSALAAAVLWRRRSMPAWWFAAGMIILGAESVLAGLSLRATGPEEIAAWHNRVLIAKSLIPFPWIAFSLTYLRGDYLRHLRAWRMALVVAFIVPAGLALGFRDSLTHVRPIESGGWMIEYQSPALGLNVALLLATILILANLEKTLRAATGTARWKIKFAILGLGAVFGTRLYTQSQALLFSGFDLRLIVVEVTSLLAGCGLILISLIRQGFGAIDLYPSRAVLQSSVTVILAGAYLVAVGILAQVAAALGGADSLPFQAFVVLAGIAGLATLLLSDRLRQRLRIFVGRHFRRPQHDARALWTAFTHRLSRVTGPQAYCTGVVTLVAESFQVLSVTTWLYDERTDSLVRGASTLSDTDGGDSSLPRLTPAAPILEGLRRLARPFDLDRDAPAWAESLRTACQPQFQNGGGRVCLPLVAADRVIGAITLLDRVNGVPYSTEDSDLLKCIGDQVAAGLLQYQLTEELVQSRELAAFQTMSTFFVHDLKNAASSLTLMLENLPVHFDDPAFRKDALRGIGSAVTRINHIIARLGSLRQKLDLQTEETDLNRLVSEAMADFPLPEEIELIQELQPLPPVMADREQLENVVTNLLLNAREAIPPAGGRITVRTALHDGHATLSIADTGCGMTSAFVRDSLFRPFHTTKKKGLGIGMFQCRMIINAHRGSVQVESEPGRGTTFRLLLPRVNGHS